LEGFAEALEQTLGRKVQNENRNFMSNFNQSLLSPHFFNILLFFQKKEGEIDFCCFVVLCFFSHHQHC